MQPLTIQIGSYSVHFVDIKYIILMFQKRLFKKEELAWNIEFSFFHFAYLKGSLVPQQRQHFATEKSSNLKDFVSKNSEYFQEEAWYGPFGQGYAEKKTDEEDAWVVKVTDDQGYVDDDGDGYVEW